MAVSGGPDSLALLLMANTAFPGRVAAATVDHGLRPEAAEEARFVAALCADRGIPHTTLTPAAPISGSIQASARAARYALLEDWRQAQAVDWLMTAHHADDQLETLVMRANRSSGVGGMAGIRARQGVILRPLLDWRRDELAALVAAAGIVPVDDPSNRDDRYDRARLRPLLSDCRLVDPIAVSAVAHNLAEADAALDWMVERLVREGLLRTPLVRDKGKIERQATLKTADLPAELLRRLMLRALAAVAAEPFTPRGNQLVATIKALARGEQTMLGTVLIRPDRQDPSHWHFRRAPPPRQGGDAGRDDGQGEQN